jgi:hypothetical protein
MADPQSNSGDLNEHPFSTSITYALDALEAASETMDPAGVAHARELFKLAEAEKRAPPVEPRHEQYIGKDEKAFMFDFQSWKIYQRDQEVLAAASAFIQGFIVGRSGSPHTVSLGSADRLCNLVDQGEWAYYGFSVIGDTAKRNEEVFETQPSEYCRTVVSNLRDYRHGLGKFETKPTRL